MEAAAILCDLARLAAMERKASRRRIAFFGLRMR